jgi:hypothetical protein
MVKSLSCLLLTLLLLRAATLLASTPDESHKREPTLTLARGTCVDRQVRRIPPEVGMRDENVLSSFTFYEPHLFSWQGGTWRSGAIPHMKNLLYPSSLATLAERPRLLAAMPEPLRATARTEIEQYANETWNRDKLAARIDRAVDWQRRSGGRVKLWCAEFGCYQAAARPADRLRYLRDMRTVLEERGIGWAYWSDNETFTIMTPETSPSGRRPPRRRTGRC